MNSNPIQQASIQDVYAAVAGAVSQDPKEMSSSAARLKDLMDQPGTLDLLQQIAAQRTAPPNQTAEHHPGKKCHVHSLEIVKVSGPRAMSSLWHISKTWCAVC